MFVYVGGESDEWANGVIASADNEDLRIFRLTDAVKLREEEIPEGADEDHDHGEDGDAPAHGDGADPDDGHTRGEYDEHVWTSPVNVISICAALRGVLAERAPELADTFAANESEYRTELEKLDASFREVAGNGTRRTVVFGDRFPLLYFVKEYGLDCYAAFPGCSSAVEASPAAVAFLIGKVKEENIPAVFHIELSKTEICEAIAEETGAKVLQFNACHNLTAEQFAAGATYISLMTGKRVGACSRARLSAAIRKSCRLNGEENRKVLCCAPSRTAGCCPPLRLRSCTVFRFSVRSRKDAFVLYHASCVPHPVSYRVRLSPSARRFFYRMSVRAVFHFIL